MTDAAKILEPVVRAMLADLAAMDAAIDADDAPAYVRARNELERKLGGQLPPVRGVFRFTLDESALVAG